MELEKETPLGEDAAADAVLNPIYNRFVCLFLVNFELFYFNRLLSSLGGDLQFFLCPILFTKWIKFTYLSWTKFNVNHLCIYL